jgi:hypothetical protein
MIPFTVIGTFAGFFFFGVLVGMWIKTRRLL